MDLGSGVVDSWFSGRKVDQINRLLLVLLIMVLIPIIWFMGIKGMTFGEFWQMVETTIRGRQHETG